MRLSKSKLVERKTIARATPTARRGNCLTVIGLIAVLTAATGWNHSAAERTLAAEPSAQLPAEPRRAEQFPSIPQRFTFSQIEMGTKFTLTFYADDQEIANAASQAAFARIGELNSLLSDYDEASELSRLSAGSPHKKPVKVSPELWTVLSHAQAVSRETGGAFDVTVGPVVRLWRRARRQSELPSPERLTAALAAIGYQRMHLDADAQAVSLTAPDMRLDLGGIAKGYAGDEALRVLRERGITQALVDVGGELVAGDAPPGEAGWRIAIASPDDAETNSSDSQPAPRYVSIANAAVAQSGDTWQFVEIDGKRYSHIVDPHTGLGLTTEVAVSVIAPDGITADALASALSVLPPEAGLKLIEAKSATEALLRTRAHAGRPAEAHASSGWQSHEVAAPADKPDKSDK